MSIRKGSTNIVRAALISLPQPGEREQPSIAGKSIAQRQLLFARECGCTAVIAFGGGASDQAIALRHAAEKAGMRYQVISNAHALPGAIKDEDSLLVLQPGMLPEARQALDLLRSEGDRMLVVSAGPGTSAGFERIDLDRAWGGALTMPGAWLGRLTGLPEDTAPHAALLRIALQQRLPEARISEDLLDDGRWMVVADDATAQKRETGWMRSHLGESSPASPSRWSATQIVSRAGSWLLDRAWAKPAILGLAASFLGGAITAAIYEMPVLSFALAALSAPTLEAFLALSCLSVAPFGKVKRWPFMRRAIDATILASGFIIIDSLWYRAAFPPFVLVAALLLLDRGKVRSAVEPFHDRALVAGGLAVLSAFIAPEVALMLVATLVLAAKLVPDTVESG
ncbi:hypothetical protein [Aurantiacibacter sp. D1-12]|uniref:hypothetical protein n=1 Tax=Aurantiacibacter sp. D1-12 TaxID=2993658 RepID=UPI00237CAF08|nr:hypothetical protein [Aurantiacibacter sp. D1-12]MDE1466636.1 hypothetical protein [Aurantiacibacter sp. D1-12]